MTLTMAVLTVWGCHGQGKLCGDTHVSRKGIIRRSGDELKSLSVSKHDIQSVVHAHLFLSYY